MRQMWTGPRLGVSGGDDMRAAVIGLGEQLNLQIPMLRLTEMPEKSEDVSRAILLAVGELLGREVVLDDLLTSLVDRMAAALGADRGTLYLVDGGKGEVFSKAAHLPEIKEIRLKLGQGIAGHVARTGETVNVSPASREPHFFHDIDRRTGYRSRSMVAVPMRDQRGTIIGVVQMLNKKGSGAFTPGDERTLHSLAAQAGVAIEATSLYTELRRAESDVSYPVSYLFNKIVGEGEAITQAYRITRKAAATDATVLIRGESGTGKELFARAVQVNGARRDKPFIKVDCAALPAGLIENELFGHEQGAYTGANRRAVGKFEAAQGGTVFIDEIGELPLPVQGKLLRVLQDRQFERVGGTETVSVNVRIIAATNRNLEKLVEEGRFRADLYYRIRVVEMVLPPLRARGREDLERLIRHFVQAAAQHHHLATPTLSASAMARLVAYPWPGNVRELENCMESAVVLSDGGVILPEGLPLPSHTPRLPLGGSVLGGELVPLHPDGRDTPVGGEMLTLAEVERRHILMVLDRVHQNRSEAARLLGIGRNTLGRKLKDFGLEGD